MNQQLLIAKTNFEEFTAEVNARLKEGWVAEQGITMTMAVFKQEKTTTGYNCHLTERYAVILNKPL